MKDKNNNASLSSILSSLAKLSHSADSKNITSSSVSSLNDKSESEDFVKFHNNVRYKKDISSFNKDHESYDILKNSLSKKVDIHAQSTSIYDDKFYDVSWTEKDDKDLSRLIRKIASPYIDKWMNEKMRSIVRAELKKEIRKMSLFKKDIDSLIQ